MRETDGEIVAQIVRLELLVARRVDVELGDLDLLSQRRIPVENGEHAIGRRHVENAEV